MTACRVGWSVSQVLYFWPKYMLLKQATGTSAFIGLGAYVYWSGRQALKDRGHLIAKQGGMVGVKGRIRGIALLSASFVGMGLYRLVN